MRTDRRHFLRSTGAAAISLANLAAASGPRVAGADDARNPPESIRFGPDIEPIVRLIEETPRDRCVRAMVEQLRGGLPYRRFLAAIFLAAIRKRDSHHSVYLIHSAHHVSLDLPPEERLLPLFWALDHYKWQQQDFPTPPMAPLEGPFPRAERAAAEFHDAMRRLDREKSECALIALARAEGARQALEQFWPYACRDSSFTGHKAIAVATCWRALETIGWQGAEPVLRFVVRDLYQGGGGPDRYYPPNTARAGKMIDSLVPGWPGGSADRGATLELFALLRQGRSDQACELASRQLAAGIGARAIWDAVYVAAAELMIIHASDSGMAGRPLHVNTTANSLHYAFATSMSARTRLLILLQAVAWVADFLRVQLGEKNLGEMKPVALEGARLPASAEGAVADIFTRLPPRIYEFNPATKTGRGHVTANLGERGEAGRVVFALMTAHPEAAMGYAQAARSWLCSKTTVEAHEFKFPAALFEDCEWVSPEWRPRLLAASAHWLHGKQSPDSGVIQQVREALRT